MDETTPPPPSAPPAVHAQSGVSCASCGYDLIGVRIGDRCPECGTQVAQFATTTQSSGTAIASMVVGIVSIITCMAYGIIAIICGPIAIYLARKAELAVQAGRAPVTSLGMAKAGRICGIIGLCLGGLYLAILLVFLAIAIFG